MAVAGPNLSDVKLFLPEPEDPETEPGGFC